MLADLQEQLELLYEVSPGHLVTDFLITDPEVMADHKPSPNIREQLLLVQNDEDLELALYIDQSVLDHLEKQNPNERLHSGNLAEYWIALEGVSHFLYLTFKAESGTSVTLLELELQAEVDKFMASCLTLLDQGGDTEALHRMLFEDVVFDSELDSDGLERYRSANRYAGKYCHRLLARLAAEHRNALVADIRHFYRLPQAEKIRYIEAS